MTATPVTDGPRRRPKDRKQQILVQARELFVQRGYPNASMTQLAERVGISASALYRHYATKAVLLEAVVRDSLDGLVPDDELDVDAALAFGARAAVARPYLGALWLREVKHLPDSVRTEVRHATGARARVPALRARRPDLTPRQLEFVAAGVQALLASPGQHSVRVAAAEHAALLTSACQALVAVELPVNGSDGDARQSAGLAPASVRERLLLAAMRLFAEHGYEETSMTDIGAAAGVTGPNLYGYFVNKAAVLDSVVERCTHALWLDLDAALVAGGEHDAVLARVVRSYTHRAWQWHGLRLDLSGEADTERRSLAYQREYVAEWVALVRSGRPELTPSSARLLVHMALAVVDDLVRLPRGGSAAANMSEHDVGMLACAVLQAHASSAQK